MNAADYYGLDELKCACSGFIQWDNLLILQSYEMSNILHRANLSNQILLQEKRMKCNKFCYVFLFRKIQKRNQ